MADEINTFPSPEETRAKYSNMPDVVGKDAIGSFEKIMYEPGTSYQTDRALRHIADIEKQQSSFMPNFIAVMAALNGNFTPAFQLQEQKRKTSLSRQMVPTMDQINKLALSGKYDEAVELANQAGASVGARSPELMQFFQKTSDKIYNQQIKQRKAETWAKTAGKNTLPTDPDYPLVQDIMAQVQSKLPIDWDTIEKTLASRPHIQNVDGQTIAQSTITGRRVVTPIPTVIEDRHVNNPVALQIAQAAKITIPQLKNILNNIEVPGVSKEFADDIRNVFNNSQGQMAAWQIGQQIPKEPSIATQMLASGDATPFEVSTGQIGPRQTPQGVVSPGLEGLEAHANRLTRQQIAVEEGKLAADPYLAKKAGITYADVSSPGSAYGMEVPVIPYSQARQMGDRLVPMRVEVYEKTVSPIIRAKQGLAYLSDMFAAYGTGDRTVKSLGAGVTKLISDKLGYAIDPNMTIGKVAELAIKRAIEQAEKTELRDDITVKQVKQFVAGEFVDANQAINAANMLIQRMNQELARVIPANRLTEDLIPDYVKQDGMTSPQQSPSGKPLPRQLDRIQKDMEKKKQQRPQGLVIK